MAEQPRPPTPRWVKVFAVVAVAIVLLVVVAMLMGGHGPSRHGAALHTAAVAAMPPAEYMLSATT